MGNRPSALTWTYLFERALDEEIGIAFAIGGGITRETFRHDLYQCRKASGDPRYNELVLFTPNAPHDNEIWICKREVEMDAN